MSRVKKITLIFLAVLLFLPVTCSISIGLRGCRWMNRAANVAEQELDPAFLLRKYEWFKDAAAQLNKKVADIKVYNVRVNSLLKINRADMDRADKEQLGLWQTELAGVTASYNSLAAEYNAQMAKINWRFCNVGQLPKGAEETLPREFAPYRNE